MSLTDRLPHFHVYGYQHGDPQLRTLSATATCWRFYDDAYNQAEQWRFYLGPAEIVACRRTTCKPGRG